MALGWIPIAVITVLCGCWRAVPDMTIGRTGHSATLLTDGKVLLVGGRGRDGAELASAELFDPGADRFVATGRLLVPRRGHVALRLQDGRVLVLGGEAAGGGALRTAESYSPALGSFTVSGSLALARAGFTATLLDDGTVLVTGGMVAGTQSDSAEVFDPTGGASTLLAAHLNVTRSGHAAIALPSGRVLIYGGRDPRSSGGGGRTEAELYDPVSHSFTIVSPTLAARSVSLPVVLQGGRVLITGGDIGGAAQLTPQSGAELFNPGTYTFKTTGAPIVARAFHTASRLASGQVLIAGGLGTGGAALSTTEQWAPKTGKFTSAPAMSTPRWGHTATVLADGRVLLAGGSSSLAAPPLATAELFQP